MKQEIKLYNGAVTIYFEERDWGNKKIHKYTDKNGKRIESVTGITGIKDKSNMLVPWAVGMMGDYLLLNEKGKPITEENIEIAKKKWREAKAEGADIGTQIHNWIEQKLKGMKPEIPDDERVVNGVTAYLKWMKSNKIEVLESERVIYSKKYHYAGTCDWYGIDKEDDALVIGDHKSSKGIYTEMRYQLAGYWLALEEELRKEFNRGYIAQFVKEDVIDKKTGEVIDKAGEFHILEIPRKEYLKDKKAFLGLRQAKKRETELKNKH